MGRSLPKPSPSGGGVYNAADGEASSPRCPRLRGRRHGHFDRAGDGPGLHGHPDLREERQPVAGQGGGGRGGRGLPRRPCRQRRGASRGPRELPDQPLHHRSGHPGEARGRLWPTSWPAAPAWASAGWCSIRGPTSGPARRRGWTAWRLRSTPSSALFPKRPVRVLLENTAGQGSCLGYRLEHLAAIRARVAAPHRVGVCLDTCHAFAAGYAIHEPAGYEDFLRGGRGAPRPRRPGLHAPERLGPPVRLAARPPRPHRRRGDRPRRLRPLPPRSAARRRCPWSWRPSPATRWKGTEGIWKLYGGCGSPGRDGPEETGALKRRRRLGAQSPPLHPAVDSSVDHGLG